MMGLDLVRALESDWRPVLDGLAHARGWPSSQHVPKLGAAVKRLSSAYNDSSPAAATLRANLRDYGPARLGFSFPRDVPKGAAAVREILAAGGLRTDRPLRILDLGAGLGAMTWGLVRALDACGPGPPVEATWVDADADALALGKALLEARATARLPASRVTTLALPIDSRRELGVFDVVLLGHVLSEMGVGDPDALRARRHGALLMAALERNTRDGGFVIVVEPALRDRTRHLHRVREWLCSEGVAPFAPCLHAGPCPALERAGDWCHEDLPVDLPSWLVPVARSAGLRFEGLTFSYLVLRKGGSSLADLLPKSHAARLRVVSSLLKTKGKTESLLCGELASTAAAGWVAGGARTMRLDRDRSAGNQGWDLVKRGQLLAIDPPPTAGLARIRAATSVEEAHFERVDGLPVEE
jgi:hypothetical protein